MNLKAAPWNFQEIVQPISHSSTKTIHEPLPQNYVRNIGNVMIVARSSGDGDGGMGWKVIFGIVFGLTMFFGLLAAFYFIIRMKLPPPEPDAPPEEIERRKSTLSRFFSNMGPSRKPDERSSYAATSSAGHSSLDVERNLAMPLAPAAAHIPEYARCNGWELSTMPIGSNNPPRAI